VDKYEEFLPFCGHSEVFRHTISDGGRSFEAELLVGFGGTGGVFRDSLFQTKYLSRVSVDPEALIVDTTSGKSYSDNDRNDNNNSSDMFDSLSSRWKLRPVVTPLPNDSSSCSSSSSSSSSSSNTVKADDSLVSTEVDFSVSMTVSDPIVAAVLDQVLASVAETQVRAFSERCGTLPPPSQSDISLAERYCQLSK